MALATGVAKQVRYKAESTFGTAPGASGAQLLRRVESTIDLSKDTYKSNEIRTDYQIADFRHGVRHVGGSIKGELSPKTYADFFAAACRRAFAAVTAISGASITIAASGSYWTVTRAAGSYLTDGVKIGDVIALTAGSFNAANINKNLMVISLTATVATVTVLNGTAMVAEGPITSATVTIRGKKTFIPTSGQLDNSFAIEHFYNDITQSELFTGCKVNTIAASLPPTGMATVDMAFMGQNITTAQSAYYTSPTAITSTGVTAAVNGELIVGGVPIAICTGLNFTINGNYSGEPVVGSNVVPNIFPGVAEVSGQFTAYFTDNTPRDDFINETEISLAVALTVDNTALADFIAFSFPRIKVGGATKSDGDKGIIQTFPFQALINVSGGAGISSEQTTFLVQDSAA